MEGSFAEVRWGQKRILNIINKILKIKEFSILWVPRIM